MLYAIISEDVADSLGRRLPVRAAHLDRVRMLADEGRLLIAGPHPAIDNEDPLEAGFTGSLIIAEFDSLEDARRWAEADPYMAAGVYAEMTVKPFRQILP